MSDRWMTVVPSDQYEREKLRAESAERQLAETREALEACIPWVASHPRGAAQEALAVACELVGSDPYDWTSYPDELTRRRELLGLPDRRAVSPADTTERRTGC